MYPALRGYSCGSRGRDRAETAWKMDQNDVKVAAPGLELDVVLVVTCGLVPRQVSKRHGKDHDPKGPLVGGASHHVLSRMLRDRDVLRWHVRACAVRLASPHRAVEPREPEVAYLDQAVVEQQVLELDVQVRQRPCR